MYLSLNQIIFFTALLAVIYIIYIQVGMNRLARRAAKRYCQQVGVQFLDQNVVLEGLSLARSTSSLFAFKRRYRFEFSSIGDQRYRGRVMLLGSRLQKVELDVFKTDSAL